MSNLNGNIAKPLLKLGQGRIAFQIIDNLITNPFPSVDVSMSVKKIPCVNKKAESYTVHTRSGPL